MRDIERQIESVEDTKKITRAMKMVASAKLQTAEQRAEDAKPFFNKTRETLISLTAGGDDDLHPLLEKREVETVGYVLMTGDRGLCGPYNNRITRKVENRVEQTDKECKLLTVGKQGKMYFDRKEISIISEYLDLEDHPRFSTAASIGREVIELYKEKVLDEVYLVYTDFESVLNQTVEVYKLLPIEAPATEETEEKPKKYLYEPSAGAVLSSVLPQYIKNLIFGALLQAKASEFASRMTAMDSATENAEEMIDDLTLSYNRARQAAITQEITEIVGGAEALE